MGIQFIHVPSLLTKTNNFIEQIEKDDPTTNEAIWDALTANGLPVASGIYLWVVEADGFGQKVGKSRPVSYKSFVA